MRDTIDEQWRPIEGYEGYEVSNLGRVRRVKGYDSLGHLRNEKILSPKIEPKGYLRVTLFKEGKGKMFFVHRLVAQAFIPNPEGLPVINHKDENPSNNVVLLKDDGSVDECRSNLEWCTVRYNTNYGTGIERMVQTKIRNGTYDPEMCGLDRKEHDRLRYQKNREKWLERQRLYYQKNREKKLEYQREYDRQRRFKEKKKDNRPSEVSLW